ncbi:MAG TPA: ACT domain-containing protein, partial [Capillimicrobium sp.]|nr:ACT domain-containing protein [Capillimicrobium sp.]
MASATSAAGTPGQRTHDTARLLVSCADGPGIVAAITSFLADRGANIITSDQYSTDPEGGRFFLRLVFHLPGIGGSLGELREAFDREVAAPRGMRFHINDAAVPKRVAVMVSRYDHCLLDLLWRTRRGELDMEIGLVVSNWPDLAAEVERFGVPYEHVPVTKETKPQAEEREL